MHNKLKYIYEFNAERVDGNTDMRETLGGKGSGLADMTAAGLPVPPGFTVSTDACDIFESDPERYEREVPVEMREAMSRLEIITGKSFGSMESPLLISVRSGAKFSMPGMMDTVLNIGLNDETVRVLARETGDEKFAYDSYRRLLQMFGDVVLGVPHRPFEDLLSEYRKKRGVGHEIELKARDLAEICDAFKALIEADGKEFPQDPFGQLLLASAAVFGSWNNQRAITYRRMNDIPSHLGTAVNVQTMVFGNLGIQSGSGVGFTRNPSTGAKELYGEFLPQAQGEEVVAGTRTPLPFSRMQSDWPEIYDQLSETVMKLETRYREMQDFEFTVENGTLYMLQTRTGKRTGMAAVRIALDLHSEGLLTAREAVTRVVPDQLDQLLHPDFKTTEQTPIARGLPASPGASVGQIVFTADDAVEWAAQGKQVLLVRPETTPEDIHGMEAAAGILTMRGGMTSHAAVVARGMGKCAVVGTESLRIDEHAKTLTGPATNLREGDVLSLDGTRGRVYEGALEKVETGASGGMLDEFLVLVDAVDAMKVRANGDTPGDATKARSFGAVGIGLCRTEHMFFGPRRLPIVQDLILAESSEDRKTALDQLLTFQRDDFYGIFEAMDGLPVTVRLLDPPLHEFLPNRQDLVEQIAELREKGADEAEIRNTERVLRRAIELAEVNPMLGHRGCRLGISLPEITEMQSRAILEAACRLKKENRSPGVEIMIPLVGLETELVHQVKVVRSTADKVFAEQGVRVDYLVGTMIELPRAALVADKLAAHADFFSFGTNDLTQTAYGFSRDDSTRFLRIYQEQGILPKDPFQTIDVEGVGALVRMAVEKARATDPSIKLGICGEHGGDPASIHFCNSLDLDYVSCSPYRVPAARLASAQAAIEDAAKETSAEPVSQAG